jgi:ABC-type sugar transport system substrate-binding protein
MKRFLLCLVIALFVPVISIAQQDTMIGVITYKTDAGAGDVLAYADLLNETFGTSVELHEAFPAEFCFEDATSDLYGRISHAGEEIFAIRDMLLQGAKGFVLTPPTLPEMLSPDIDDYASEYPIVVTMREVPGLDLPYFGLDFYALGKAWADQIDEGTPRPFAVVGYFDDPMQAAFLEGLKTSAHFRAAYDVPYGTGRGESADAYLDHPDIYAILVTEPKYAAGAAATVEYLRDELGQVVKVGSLGLPLAWEDLYARGLLHGVVGWDQYEIIRQATAGLLDIMSSGAKPENVLNDAIYYAADTSQSTIPYPYTEVDSMGQFWK